MLTIDSKKLNIKPGDSILDLGCGEGRHAHAFYANHNLHVIALDRDPECVKKTKAGFKTYFSGPAKKDSSWTVLEGDCQKLPMPDGSLDVVCCSEVLEHLPDYESALKEMHRVLHSDGTLAISVPRSWPERICWILSPEYSKDPGGHLRIFNASVLKKEIEDQGFKFQKKHFAHGIHPPLWWLKCLNWEKRDTWLPVRLYHKMLVWDILSKPLFTRALDRLLTPFMGKSVVLYFSKEAP